MLWLKRINVVLIVLTTAFIGGYYLRPLGVGWVVASVAVTIILAIAWMRVWWSG